MYSSETKNLTETNFQRLAFRVMTDELQTLFLFLIASGLFSVCVLAVIREIQNSPASRRSPTRIADPYRGNEHILKGLLWLVWMMPFVFGGVGLAYAIGEQIADERKILWHISRFLIYTPFFLMFFSSIVHFMWPEIRHINFRRRATQDKN